MAVGGEYVFEAIVVEIEHSTTPPGPRVAGLADAGRVRHIAKVPAQIAKQRKGLVGQRGDEEVVFPVIVIVPKIYTHGRQRHSIIVVSRTCFHRDFFESSIATVMK